MIARNHVSRRMCNCFVLVVLWLCIGCGGGGSSSGGPGSSPPPPIPTVETNPHPPFRSRYLRTDSEYNPNALEFFPPHLTAYDRVHKRFFMSNTTLNRIDVFDSVAESQVRSILVPSPFGLDVAPDGSKLYVVTSFGDVYLIDPGAMQVLQRFPSSSIGPQGYRPTQVFILADGKLALEGPNGGFLVDGSPNFAVWNPTDNTITIVTDFSVGNIGQMTVTGDRTKVIIGGASNQLIAVYDPSTNTSIRVSPNVGFITEILATPDGKRIFVLGTGAEVFDASTLAELGSFDPGGADAVLSLDGSTIYAVNSISSVFATDTTTFMRKGWVANFNVVDLQQLIVPSAIDETGLIAGPIGHGAAFLDAAHVNQGQSGTDFNVGFLAPNTGPVSGGTALQTEILAGGSPITTGTVYIGNAGATNVSLSSSLFKGDTPPATAEGPADFTLVLPDGTIRMMPEDFSYGPTIVEVSTNASSAEGGAQGAIFGYGFGQQPSDVQVTIGGQPTAVTQVIQNASVSFPYPFPMDAIVFTVPPGTAGSSGTVTVATANGSASVANAFHYIPALQSYPLAGAFLMQGVYDPFRSVIYFTNQAQIEVFSPLSKGWLSPIALPNTDSGTVLVGIALSPDGNTLAVSDAGHDNIYVLNPGSASTAKGFGVNTGVDVKPFGVAVTDSGSVYYGTHDQNSDPPGELNKLNTTTGAITTFNLLKDADLFTRVLMSSDGTRVYANDGSGIWVLNTSDDSVAQNPQASNASDGNEDGTVSANGSVVLTGGLLADSDLNLFSDLTYVDRDVVLEAALFGQKVNANGSLVFQPLVDGLDILDGTTGLLQDRVELPLQLPTVFDSFAIDNADGLLFAITQTGIIQINVSSLPSNASSGRLKRAMTEGQASQHRNSESAAVSPINRRPHLHDVLRTQLRLELRNANPLGLRHLK